MVYGEGADESHNKYCGEGFSDYLDAEIFYELERDRSSHHRGSEGGYQEVRKRVLEGLVLRGIDLFSDWEGETAPKDCIAEGVPNRTRDERNLRESLDLYIEEAKEMAEVVALSVNGPERRTK